MRVCAVMIRGYLRLNDIKNILFLGKEVKASIPNRLYVDRASQHLFALLTLCLHNLTGTYAVPRSTCFSNFCGQHSGPLSIEAKLTRTQAGRRSDAIPPH
jgi:hypothetical protein